MTAEERQQHLADLNEKCERCLQKNGYHPERCEYSCIVGKEIHKLDFVGGSEWGTHSYWKQPN